MKRKIDFKKDMKVIKNVLLDFFDEENIFIDDNMILFPAGTFSLEKKIGWTFSFDGTFCIEALDMQCVIILLNMLYAKNFKISIFEWFYNVFNEEGICAGTIFNSDIEAKAEELGIDYYDAKAICEGKMIDDFMKELESKEGK
jgi:hypothetical protein